MEDQEVNQIASLIQDEYVLYLLRNGKDPISVLQFAETIGIEDQEFYAHFNNFKSVEKAVWKSFIDQTIEVLHNDSEYSTYSSREKSLAFFYTFIEVLKQNRSLVLFRLDDIFTKRTIPFFLSDFFKSYNQYMKELLTEAMENQEIVARPIISDQYIQAYKLLMGYIMKVWINDSSSEYQTTDAAIEKSVNLTFDLLQKGPLDAIIDFAKFAYQNKAF